MRIPGLDISHCFKLQGKIPAKAKTHTKKRLPKCFSKKPWYRATEIIRRQVPGICHIYSIKKIQIFEAILVVFNQSIKLTKR